MKTTMNITQPAFALFAFACFALSPQAGAQLSPPPDGGYYDQSGFAETTAEGTGALFNMCIIECFGNPQGNTAIGFDALYSNYGGNYNTATGALALFTNNGGSGNTASGYAALTANTTGNSNTATGYQALLNNTTGGGNTANGYQALATNNTASGNTAIGNNALAFNTIGSVNTASGNFALNANRNGSYNTAIGEHAMVFSITGSRNTAVGQAALSMNTSGNSNIAVGFSAGSQITSGNNNIDIGNTGVAGDSASIRIGGTQTKTFMAGISGATVPGGVGVIVGSNGKLGTVVSSARFKEEIKPMDKASEAILALKPVTFHYKHDLDPEGIPQFGLVAEEVEKVNPNLVARDDQGKPYTVRYEAVNAMLLNEFLKEHRTVQDLKAVVVHQQKQIETLTAGLEKVSVELELSKPAPQTVLNNR